MVTVTLAFIRNFKRTPTGERRPSHRDVLNGVFSDQIECFKKGIGEKPDEMSY